ncbi:50S ribosomal protein L23 [candidate division WWE3 bacterium CG08_land_8_20_14_0_20_41_15]|uniref:Large ribosomal subunit protein uL23 n=2 Tax=Katanobacteria TaxID=422282 RepID=A0A2H0X8N7_UNCKA|nr:MAG: 50S ribosomal protein L23 [candidate division WWE3 bacterium CG08_land_8_20_14_0_20_41_15]
MNTTREVILKPMMTEKTAKVTDKGVYAFSVATWANAQQIKEAVFALFGVKAINVHTIMTKGEIKRSPKSRQLFKKPNSKKAYVTIEKGKKIDIFESLKG